MSRLRLHIVNLQIFYMRVYLVNIDEADYTIDFSNFSYLHVCN